MSSRAVKERKVANLSLLEVTGEPNRGTILLLHGYGADAHDLFPLSTLYKGPTWIFPQAPLEITFAPGFTGKAWFPVDLELMSRAIEQHRFDEVAKAFPPELKEARERIDALIEELNIPRSKLILGGFSQGAVLAIETALHYHERCGGLLIFSGTLVNEAQWSRLAPLHAPTPFFQSHGSRDPLLPIQKAQELEHLFIEHGLKGKLHAFSGGHEIPHSILTQLPNFLTHII